MSPRESEVVEAAAARAAALAARDADALRTLHHPNLRWTTHRGDVLDRDRYIAGNTESDLVWLDQDLTDVAVTIHDDTAVLTCRVTDRVDRGDGPEMFTMRVTQTWVRRDRRWTCLAGHAGPRTEGADDAATSQGHRRR